MGAWGPGGHCKPSFPSAPLQEFPQKTWLSQFRVLMVPQLYAKYETNLMSQS